MNWFRNIKGISSIGDTISRAPVTATAHCQPATIVRFLAHRLAALCKSLGQVTKGDREWHGRSTRAHSGRCQVLLAGNSPMPHGRLPLPVPDRAIDLGAHSPVMLKLVELATRAAQVDSTVLITGESGVGKERLAHYLHYRSARSRGPFVPVNCGALSEGLIEGELFGHIRGAFTGAVTDHAGLFEAADGGTILLDEIGELSLWMQVKLLRVLQEREIRRVGDHRQRRVDVRVIAATNRNLALDVAHERFRRDLYYRVKVIEFDVPPLRERPADLRALARAILADRSQRMARKISGYTDAALDAILRYEWPGNVRELENAIERACALATGNDVDVDDLPPELWSATRSAASPSEVRPLRDVERDYILEALKRNRGNKTKTAEQLRIGTATLFRKLKAVRAV